MTKGQHDIEINNRSHGMGISNVLAARERSKEQIMRLKSDKMPKTQNQESEIQIDDDDKG